MLRGGFAMRDPMNFALLDSESNYSVTRKTLKRCLEDLGSIHQGRAVCDAHLLQWLEGYFDSFKGDCTKPTSEYMAGYAFGYAEGERPPEEY